MPFNHVEAFRYSEENILHFSTFTGPFLYTLYEFIQQNKLIDAKINCNQIKVMVN